MADPRIIIANQDIYALGYVSNIAGINEKKTFQKDKLISNTYNLLVENYDNFFSINNSNSLFSGTNWLYEPIQVYNRDEELIWDGVITAIERNHNTKTAIVKSKNLFFKFRNDKVEYTSSDYETPAIAFKNICDTMGFTGYNEASINTSDALYVAAGCYTKLNINLSDNLSFQHCLEKMGEYGNADVYSHKNEIYYVHWVPFTGGVSVTLNANEKDKLKSLPIITEEERDLINQYNIGYEGDGGTAATDTGNNNIGLVSRNKLGVHSLREMRSSDDTQFMFKDLTSAVYIGEGYIRRSQKNLSTDPAPLTKIKFNIFSDNKEWLDLQSYFRLTLPDESWTDKIFEVFEFNISEDNDDISLLAYEVV